jgi:autotransporter-associated beta strand protein
VYVADQTYHLIRKISPSGNVSTLGGSGGNSGTSDGIGTVARFYYPFGVTVDPSGNLYVADRTNHTIRKATPYTLTASLAASALGAPVDFSNATIELGSLNSAGVLVLTGTAQTTLRPLALTGTTGGAILDQSGTGALVFAGSLSVKGAGAKTLVLQGGTSGTGQILAGIPDFNAGNPTSLFKQGTGTWTLSGASSYSGGTTLAQGTLSLGNMLARVCRAPCMQT